MRVLVATKDHRFLRSLKPHLRATGQDLRVVPDSKAVLSEVNETVDLIVLDDGAVSAVRVCRQLVRTGGGTSPAFILVIGSGDVNARSRALNAGADQYVRKPFDTSELLARVRAAERRTQHAGAALTVGEFTVDVAQRCLIRGGVRTQLSAKEFLLLMCLLRGNGRVVARAAIQNEVWPGGSTRGNVVEFYVHRLRAKLASRSGDGTIRSLRGIGYAFIV